jgi:HEAT repeat protein
VEWLATMPASQVEDVKAQIAAVRSDPKVVDAVAAGLSFRNLGSYGRQLIYLSILGEMQNERALGPLQSYLNSPDCLVFEERVAVRPAPNAPNTSIFDGCAGLKARGVSMIAHLNSEAATAVVLNAIKEHPSRTVRLAAIDAYLYNNGDSPEAIATAKRLARPDEGSSWACPVFRRHQPAGL